MHARVFLWRCLLTLPADLRFLAVQRIRFVMVRGYSWEHWASEIALAKSGGMCGSALPPPPPCS